MYHAIPSYDGRKHCKMSEIYFVRHGQASLGAKNYDQLSDLGWEQARWLGQHLRERDLSFDRVIVGDMRRHKETLQGIGEGMSIDYEPVVDPRFNEFTFRPVMGLYQQLNKPGADEPKTAREFMGILREVMEAWIVGELDEELQKYDQTKGVTTESWEQFNQRVVAGLDEARPESSGERVLIVSSGGPKSLAMKHVMGLSNDATIELMLQIRNTSVTRFLSNTERLTLRAFNGLGHMERTDRQHAITMV